jgi:hypothetical protein
MYDIKYEFGGTTGPLDWLDLQTIEALRVGYSFDAGVIRFKRIRKPAAPRYNPSHFKGRGIKHPAKRPVGRSMDVAMDWHEAGYGDALARRPSRSLDADYREGYSDGIRAREEHDSYGSFSDEKLYRSNHSGSKGRSNRSGSKGRKNGMIRRAASSAAGYAGRFAGGQAAGLQDALSDPEFMAALVAAGGAEVASGGAATPVTGTVALLAFYRYWQRKKAREAAANAKAKTRKNGEPYEDYLIIARAYRALGQTKKAADYERRARALAPGRSKLRQNPKAKAAKAKGKGTKVQSFVFDPARGWTVKLARAWVENHGYTVLKTDRPVGGQIHVRIASPRTHQVVGTIPMGTGTGIQARVARTAPSAKR